METLIALILVLIVLALLLWCVRALLPLLGLPEPIGTVLYVLIVLVAVLYLARRFGVL